MLSIFEAFLPTFINSSLIANQVLNTAIFVIKELTNCFDSDSLNSNKLYKIEQILDYKVSYCVRKEEYLYKVCQAGYKSDNNK